MISIQIGEGGESLSCHWLKGTKIVKVNYNQNMSRLICTHNLLCMLNICIDVQESMHGLIYLEIIDNKCEDQIRE